MSEILLYLALIISYLCPNDATIRVYEGLWMPSPPKKTQQNSPSKSLIAK